jgi:ParB-like chromosome segregation protein Spo0J
MALTRAERLAQSQAKIRNTVHAAVEGVDSLPVSPKGQTQGPAEELSKTPHRDSPAIARIKGSIELDVAQIVFDDSVLRDASEYETDDFMLFMHDIRRTRGNMIPIEVAELKEDGIVTGYRLIAGTRRFVAARKLAVAAEVEKLNAALQRIHQTSAKGKGDPLLFSEHDRSPIAVKLRANVRVVDDASFDQLHDVENAQRASKSPYSFAIQLKHMMASGRYSTQAQLADALGRDKGAVSRMLSLIEKAPDGLWSAISDPAALTFRDADILLKAFQKPSFISWSKSLAKKSTRSSTLMKQATESLARPRTESTKSLADRVIEKKRGKDFAIHIPGEVPSELRAKALKYVRELLSSPNP